MRATLLCNMSSRARPIAKETRDITVNPKLAPNEIIRNQIPTRDTPPSTPLCSDEK
jgi:hypothetical protein